MTATTDRTFLGVEVGGTKLQLALGRGDGRIIALERRVIRPEGGAKALLVQMSEAHASLLSTSKDARPSAVGIGFGGPVDADRGVILRSHQVEGWNGFPLADWARQELGIPLAAVENDADTAGLGEARFGAGRSLSPIFFVTVGSGIGGGLILDGRIYRGSGMGASEIGHLWVDGTGPDHLRGSSEAIASGWSIGGAPAARRSRTDWRAEGSLRGDSRGRPESKVDAPVVARAAEQGDPRAIEILARATRAAGPSTRARGHLARPPADHPRGWRLAPGRRPVVSAVPGGPRRPCLTPFPGPLRPRPRPPRRGGGPARRLSGSLATSMKIGRNEIPVGRVGKSTNHTIPGQDSNGPQLDQYASSLTSRSGPSLDAQTIDLSCPKI